MDLKPSKGCLRLNFYLGEMAHSLKPQTSTQHSYDEETHTPIEGTPRDRSQEGCDVRKVKVHYKVENIPLLHNTNLT